MKDQWKKILLFLVTAEISFGSEKHWLPDLEWQTGSNWVGGVLPDANSRVIFPGETWHAVGLPKVGNVEVAEIYLAKEGSLYLGVDGILKFTVGRKKVKSVEWSKKGIYMWIDPDNWNGYTQATPHAERIPCDKDVVVLPSKSRTLNLALPTVDMHIQAVRVEDENTTLNRWEWSQLSDGPREFFQNHLTVTYAPAMLQMCIDCTCHGNADEAVAEEVCAFIWQAESCKPSTCEYPLKVEGHCCDYCGGRVSLSGKVLLKKVEAQVNEALERYRTFVTWHVRKTWKSDIEVLIVENGKYEGIKTNEAVNVLSDILTDKNFVVLDKMVSGGALNGSTLSTILGPMLGIPLILLLMILVIFPYFGYSYSQLMSGWREAWSSIPVGGGSGGVPKSRGFFGFARFENVAEGDVKLDDAKLASPGENYEEDSDVDQPSSSGSKRFENPLYRSKRETITDKNKSITEEKMIDIDGPVTLTGLESRIHDDGIEEILMKGSLENSILSQLSQPDDCLIYSWREETPVPEEIYDVVKIQVL